MKHVFFLKNIQTSNCEVYYLYVTLKHMSPGQIVHCDLLEGREDNKYATARSILWKPIRAISEIAGFLALCCRDKKRLRIRKKKSIKPSVGSL